ncbi:hypothetical protein Ciccas_009174 [Cichlidogyrus casuarinus]|uniref:Uncharacterized protein n=1 Tax=Cichlidogyrus casuarinus TaxID=1844966 RepID=A0ABD2PXT7_9PLAT
MARIEVRTKKDGDSEPIVLSKISLSGEWISRRANIHLQRKGSDSYIYPHLVYAQHFSINALLKSLKLYGFIHPVSS